MNPNLNGEQMTRTRQNPQNPRSARRAHTGRTHHLALAAVLAAFASAAAADVPGRAIPRGTVPNPGTQQQELSNITFPAPFNVFEFTVTCAGCHGGTIDQQAAHFGVQGGTNMASAARDPIFRANQIAVNNILKAVTTEDGAGNMCMRCHSPNGWYSGRFDPTLGGDPQGKTMMHSIVASTDDEGISCESCHRAVGNVKHQSIAGLANTKDPAWKMLAGIGGYPNDKGWPHDGAPITNINPGDPYGDTTIQYADGMTYGGPYPGSINPSFSDNPGLFDLFSTIFPGFTSTSYTGQIFAIYPPGWRVAGPNGTIIDVGGQPVRNVDGSLAPMFEQPVGAPIDMVNSNFNVNPPIIVYDYQAQSISVEHPTFENKFLKTSEMCASCHELTVPVASHGMPEQRTFTEWKYSAYSKANAFQDPTIPSKPALPAGATKTYNSLAGEIRCQDCHMPKVKHEYDDISPVSLNADPVMVGFFPYGKDRNDTGGTSSHKHAGANRDLPDYMKLLYPEPDLEVIGAQTGNDTRIFPGMLSTRDPLLQRSQRNTELSLRDGVGVEILAVTETGAGVYEVQVKVVNKTGHKIPSGYPDGRRFWIGLEVKDSATGTPVYTSGYYDAANADLLTAPGLAFKRALQPTIDATVAGGNAVMVYERVTCWDGLLGLLNQTTQGRCQPDEFGNVMGPNLLNNAIAFDNRIPPTGFDYAKYQTGGAGFWVYDPVTLAYREDATRYPAGQGFDLVTYRFTAPAGQALQARATAYWQTHSKEFMEHLRVQDSSTVRPEGPVNAFMPGYPLTPSYLSDVVINQDLKLPWFSGPHPTMTWAQFTTDKFGVELKDNWGGVAYAAWALTGKGAPYVVVAADTSVAAVPGQVTGVSAATPTVPDPVNLTTSAFETLISWAAPTAGPVEGYEVWIRFGLDIRNSPGGPDVAGSTASWDRLAVVPATETSLKNVGVNVGKTYAYAVRAFNAAGFGPFSSAVTFKQPWDFPLPPDMLQQVGAANDTTVTLSWMDTADNEAAFLVEAAVITGNLVGPFNFTKTFATQTGCDPATAGCGGPGQLMAFGGNMQTVTGLQPETCYLFQVQAVNATGRSGPNTNAPINPICTTKATIVLPAPTGLTAAPAAANTIHLAWAASPATVSTATLTGYVVDVQPGATQIPVAATQTALDVTGLTAGVSYTFVVSAVYGTLTSPASAPASATPLPAAPRAPSAFTATATGTTTVALSWGAPAAQVPAVPVTGYRVVYGVATVPLAANVTTLNVTGLTPATLYSFSVFAENTGGSSPAATASATTQGAPPVAPLLSASAITGTTATLAWSNVGATSYTVRQTVPAGAPPIPVGAVLTRALTGLTPGTSYSFVVDATNAGGTTTSNTVTFTTLLVAPAAPTGFAGLSSVPPTSGFPVVTLTWNASAGATSYVLQRQANGNWDPLATVTSATPYVVTGLQPGSTTRYRIRAVNSAGVSAWVTTGNVTVAQVPATSAPGAVVIAATRAGATDTVTVTWTNNAPAATSFTIQWRSRTGNGGNWGNWTNVTGTASPLAITGVQRNRQVEVRIRAIGPGGVTTANTTSNRITTP